MSGRNQNGEVVDADAYQPRNNHQCMICGEFIIGNREALVDHSSRCLALRIAQVIQRREREERQQGNRNQ